MTTSASQLCSYRTAVDYQLCVGPGYCGLADLRPLPHSFIPTVFSIHSTVYVVAINQGPVGLRLHLLNVRMSYSGSFEAVPALFNSYNVSKAK